MTAFDHKTMRPALVPVEPSVEDLLADLDPFQIVTEAAPIERPLTDEERAALVLPEHLSGTAQKINFLNPDAWFSAPETAAKPLQDADFSETEEPEEADGSIVSSPFSSSSLPSCLIDAQASDSTVLFTGSPSIFRKPKRLSKKQKAQIAACAPVPLTPWPKLDTPNKLKRYAQGMAHPHAVTFQLSHEILAKAATKPNPVQWAIAQIVRRLKAVLGDDLKIVLTAEPNNDRCGFHFHGVMDVEPARIPAVRKALRLACGTWNPSAKKFQFHFDDKLDLAWGNYIVKDGALAVGRGYYASQPATQAAKDHHAADCARRKAKRNALKPTNGPRRVTEEQAPVPATHAAPKLTKPASGLRSESYVPSTSAAPAVRVQARKAQPSGASPFPTPAIITAALHHPAPAAPLKPG